MSRMVCSPARRPAIAVRPRCLQFTGPANGFPDRNCAMALTLTRNEAVDGIDEPAPPHGFGELLAEVGRFWARLPDKPEESAEGVARALWLAAAGTPASVERAADMALPGL